jgi:PAS domain S-box-containing protein
MLKIIKQNQNIIIVSIGLFIISLTALLFLVNNSDKNENGELKADVVNAGETVGSEKSEESTYRKQVNNYDDPLIVIRIDGTVEYSSPDFKSSAGYDQATLHNKLFYSLLNPEDLSIFLGAYGKAMASEEAVTMIGPYRIRNADGKYSVNMGSLYPVKNGDKVQKIILTTRNISGDLNISDKSALEEKLAPKEINTDPENEIMAEPVVSDDASMLKTDIFESSAAPLQITQETPVIKTNTPLKAKSAKQKINKTKPGVIKEKIEEPKVKFGEIFDTSQNETAAMPAKEPETKNTGDFNYKNSKIFSHKLTFNP